MNICVCGCGKECNKKFVRGHHKGHLGYRKPKIQIELNFCLCGCNEMCKNKFVSGHNSRGVNNNFQYRTNYKHSEKTKKAIGKGQLGRTGWNKGLTKETDARVLINAENIKKAYFDHGDEIMIKNLKNSGLKRFFYTSSSGAIIKMRSIWEVIYAKYLDSLNLIWKYEPKGFKLSNGKRYYPDFHLPELNEFHEIKGYLSEDGKKKIDLFEKEYPNIKFKMLMKLDLQKLGVL